MYGKTKYKIPTPTSLQEMAATELEELDHLTVHSDLASGGAGLIRRLAVVIHLGTDGWSPECGGAFVWCAPEIVVPHEFNALTVFPVHDGSEHMVEPVWGPGGAAGHGSSGSLATAAGCAGERRIAWAGWYSSPSRGDYPELARRLRVLERLASAGVLDESFLVRLGDEARWP
jgi:Rps23 Pro-64 3,4-dihydroxylase Tpa1-like proline 4-hydroxylase